VSFKVDAEMKFGDLSYPRNNSRLTHEEKGYTTNLYNGTIGKDDTPDGLLTIRSKNAGVRISFND
jgi:hypothetical protein